MPADFENIQLECNKRVMAHRQRDDMFRAMKDMVYMDWHDRPGADHIKPTMSPDPYNTIMGVTRLMVSTDPRIRVAPASEASIDKQAADHMEKCLYNLWGRINNKRRWPVHYDAVMSAAMFSEIVLQIGRTQDVVDLLKERNSPKAKLMERYARQVPYTIDVIDPTTVYPEYGAFGLRSVLRRFKRPVWQIKEFWGKAAEDAGLSQLPNESEVEYNEYWDDTYRVVWSPSGKNPICNEEHELPFIPYVCTIVSGSGMFSLPHEQRFPLLYPLWKGSWWQRQNLSYTLLYTMMTILGNGSWVSKTQNKTGVNIDFGQLNQEIKLEVGESIEPLGIQLLPNEMGLAMELASSKIQESTLPRVVFGEAPSKTMAYSSLNLLSQGGRLPLVPIERQGGSSLAEAIEIILQWIEFKGDEINLWSSDKTPDLKAADINPDYIDVSITLRADVPEDKLKLSNMVTMLMGSMAGDGMPIISRKTAQEYMGNDQPDEDLAQVLYEKMRGLYINREITKLQQEMEAQAAPQEPQQPETPEKPVEGHGFDPSRGGIPPVQAQGMQEMTNPDQIDAQIDPLKALLGPQRPGGPQ
jgi:hypothetical protein